MNVEEILIRLGVDAKAVTTGLNQTTSYVKGWGASLAASFKGIFGKVFAVAAASAGFDIITNKIMNVKRASEQLGVSTNFVQGLFNKTKSIGQDYDKLSKPLISFKATIDAAKEGSFTAREKLELWGITAKNTNYQTLRFDESLSKLADRYVKLGKNIEMLKDLGVRPSSAMLDLLKNGGGDIAAMNQSNFFTKFTPNTIAVAAEFKRQMAMTGNVVSVTLGNTVGELFHYARHIEGSLGYLPKAVLHSINNARNPGGDNSVQGQLQKENQYITDNERKEQAVLLAKKEQAAYDAAELEAEKEGFTIEEKRLEVQTEIRNLQEEQLKLQTEIQDRGKSSVEQLADRARHLLGLSKLPRGLQSIYTVTPAMQKALQIQTLEDQAQIAAAYGDNLNRARFVGEADQLRNSPLFKYGDRYPTRGMTNQLQNIAEKLDTANQTLDRLPQRQP